jgi:hypothetical protein
MLKQSQRKLRSRRKSSSRSTLNATPSNRASPNEVVPEQPRVRRSIDDWYNEVDVSISSTGSDIRRRLHADLGSHKNVTTHEDISPIAYVENAPPRTNTQSYQMYTPQVAPCGPTSEGDPFVPSWVTRNPHLANLYDPSRLGSVQLPPLFRQPITMSSAELGYWSIPPPVLYGLGKGGR